MRKVNEDDGRGGRKWSKLKQRFVPAAEKIWRAESQVLTVVLGKFCFLSQGFLQDKRSPLIPQNMSQLCSENWRDTVKAERCPALPCKQDLCEDQQGPVSLRPSLAERDCPGASVGNLPGANFTPRGRSLFCYTFNYFLISLALLHHIYLYFHAWVAAVIDQHQDFLHLISGEKVLLNH